MYIYTYGYTCIHFQFKSSPHDAAAACPREPLGLRSWAKGGTVSWRLQVLATSVTLSQSRAVYFKQATTSSTKPGPSNVVPFQNCVPYILITSQKGTTLGVQLHAYMFLYRGQAAKKAAQFYQNKPFETHCPDPISRYGRHHGKRTDLVSYNNGATTGDHAF